MNSYYPYEKPERIMRGVFTTNDTLTYVMVPKNASSSIKSMLGDLGWEQRDGGGTYFGVVRDPVQRWVSGMTQSFYRITAIKRKLLEDIGPFIDDPWFDIHQSPQHLYFQDLQSPRLYKLQHITMMLSWLRRQGVETPELINKNVAAQYRPRRELYERILEQVTPEYNTKLREFYKEDQLLYEEAF